MTIEERKRAKLLEKISYKLGNGVSTKTIIISMTILTVLADILFFQIDLTTGEFTTVLFSHNLMVYLFLGIPSTVSVTLFGDNTTANDAPERYGTTMFLGNFFGTMPFKAKDLINLRLMIWEMQFAIATIITVILQLALIKEEHSGCTVYYREFSNSLLCYVGMEICLLVVSLSRKHLIIGIASVLGGLLLFGNFRADYVEDGLFTGASGIAFIIVSAVVITAAAEFIVSKRKKISWGLK